MQSFRHECSAQMNPYMPFYLRNPQDENQQNILLAPLLEILPSPHPQSKTE